MSGTRPSCWCTATDRCPNWPMARRWSTKLSKDELFGELREGKLHLLSDRDARAVPQPRPHHRPHHRRTSCSTTATWRRSIIETDRIMMCGSPGMLKDLTR